MGIIRKIAIVVLTISFITFIALFGQLPELRYADTRIRGQRVIEARCLSEKQKYTDWSLEPTAMHSHPQNPLPC